MPDAAKAQAACIPAYAFPPVVRFATMASLAVTLSSRARMSLGHISFRAGMDCKVAKTPEAACQHTKAQRFVQEHGHGLRLWPTLALSRVED